jgi:hypothetical protein
MLIFRLSLGAALFACIAATASATDKFALAVTPGIFFGHYDGSQYRDKIQGENVYLQGQYASKWGFAAAYEHSRIKYQLGFPDFVQNAVFLSGHASYIPHHAWASYTFRLDLHSVSATDSGNSSDDVRVVAPQVSYLPFNHSIYLDLGYADSRYGESTIIPGALRIQQWTPTLGMILTPGASNWMQLRGYYIHSSNPLRSQNKTDTFAVEVKYRYYPGLRGRLIPQNIKVGVLVGHRIFAVDRDTASVANLAELEKGGISLGAEWRLTKNTGLLLGVHRSQFRELGYYGYNDYVEKSIWLGVVTHWKRIPRISHQGSQRGA